MTKGDETDSMQLYSAMAKIETGLYIVQVSSDELQ